MEKKILVLEINGKKKLINYQKTLYEASVLGISHVMFLVVFDHSEKHSETIRAMVDSIIKSCDLLKIKPIQTYAQVYESESFMKNSVGTMDNYGSIKTMVGIPTFANYKRKKVNQEKIKNAETFDKVYAKKLQKI